MFCADSEIYTVYSVAAHFSHDEACRLARLAKESPARTVVLDMALTDDASTAAFARLVLLRRELRLHGRDLQLADLRGRAAQLFEVHRLQRVLPQLATLPETADAEQRCAQPAKIERGRPRRRVRAI